MKALGATMKGIIRRACAVAVCLLGGGALLIGQAEAQNAVGSNSRYAAVVVDWQTGAVLHAENADEPRFPASLTKTMTLYLAFEALDEGRLSLEQRLPVSAWAQSMSPTKLGLIEGNTIKVEHAVLGLVTKSANDAAVVLAEALGGSESRFADMMTRKARALGMSSTTFRNASGLPDAGQVSTARDLAVLGAAIVRDHPKYYHYFSRRDFVYGGRKLPNHNRLMSRYEGMDGIKTGYIGASGFNLIGSAIRDGRRLTAVVMGGRSPLLRDNRMAELLDAGFEKIGVSRRAPAASGLVAQADAPPKAGRKPAAPTQTAVRDRRDDIGRVAAAALKAAPRPAAPAGQWSIQVGAFNTKQAGNQALVSSKKQAAKHIGGARAVVTTLKTAKGTVYRARFVGMGERDARQACAALSKAGRACTAVAPQS